MPSDHITSWADESWALASRRAAGPGARGLRQLVDNSLTISIEVQPRSSDETPVSQFWGFSSLRV